MDDTTSVYLDNAATTFPKPPGVLERGTELYKEYGASVGRGTSSLADKGQEIINQTRELLSNHFSTNYPECVIFSPSASLALNQLILGIEDRHSFYYSPFEHNSILRPLHHLRMKRGKNITQIPFKNDFCLDYTNLELRFEETLPEVLCLNQTSNVCGYELPIYEIVKLAKEFNPEVLVIVDGAQTSGFEPLNMEYIDYYVFSGHKSFFAGYGIAGWIMKEPKEAKNLNPIHFGGTGTKSELLEMPDIIPSKFEVGSHNIWAISTLLEALRWKKEFNMSNAISNVKDLGKKLKLELNQIKDLNLYVPPEEKWYPIFSVTFKGKDSNEVGNFLKNNGISIRTGFHCAPLAHKWLNTIKYGGTLRISPSIFNSQEDIEVLIDNFNMI